MIPAEANDGGMSAEQSKEYGIVDSVITEIIKPSQAKEGA